MADATTTGSGVANRPTETLPLLRIEGLNIHFRSERGLARVVDDCNLVVRHNEIVGIAGESGSGKTTLVEALLQIIRFPNREASGKVLFSPDGRRQIDLMTLSDREMRHYRGRHIAYVPQGSMNSLNPVSRVGDQIAEGLVAHGISERVARSGIGALLDRVGLDAKVSRLFPHELSGGMKQRIIIANAIAMEPELIVADEPTTALDVNVQRRIIETLDDLRRTTGVAILIVSHDLPVHAQLADRIGVMYAGQIIEAGDIRDTLKTPMHPYAAGLMNAIPSIGGSRERLTGIGGRTPSPLAWPAGCRFHNRCPHAMPVCREQQPLLAEMQPGPRWIVSGPAHVGPDRLVACHLYPESTPHDA